MLVAALCSILPLICRWSRREDLSKLTVGVVSTFRRPQLLNALYQTPLFILIRVSLLDSVCHRSSWSNAFTNSHHHMSDNVIFLINSLRIAKGECHGCLHRIRSALSVCCILCWINMSLNWCFRTCTTNSHMESRMGLWRRRCFCCL